MKFSIIILLCLISFACALVFADGIPADAAKLTVSKRGSPVVTLNGQGSQTTRSFQLNGGPATFAVRLLWEKPDTDLKGREGDFSVLLIDENQEYVDLVIGTIDSFDGARTVEIPKTGAYMLKIVAPGNWTVEIEQ